MFKKDALIGFYASDVHFFLAKKQGQPKENLFVLNMFGNLVSEKSKPQKSRQLLFYAQIFILGPVIDGGTFEQFSLIFKGKFTDL